MLSRAGKGDLVLAIISGGGSSLLTLPYEGMTLDDLRAVNRVLVTGGPAIQEINTVRKHLCRVKGGGLRLAAPEATFATLILSDVIGDDLSSIASGPTVPDYTTRADALAVLESYSLLERIPESARARLMNPSPEEERLRTLWEECAARTQTVIVASNAVLLDTLTEQLEHNQVFGTGLHIIRERAPVLGPVQAVVPEHLRRCEELRQESGVPLMVLFGGEPVVAVPDGAHGTGGRMLHYSLLAADAIEGTGWSILASGTDGIDGTAPAAGAVVDGATTRLSRKLGLEPAYFLRHFDSYGFFQKLEDGTGQHFLNMPGPTGTNVNDIMLWVHGT